MAKQMTCLLVIVLALVFVWADDGSLPTTAAPTVIPASTSVPASTSPNGSTNVTPTPVPPVAPGNNITTLSPSNHTEPPTTNTTTTTTTTTTPTTPTTTTTSTTSTPTTKATTTTVTPTTTPASNSTTTATTPASTAKPTAAPTQAPLHPASSWGWGPFFAGIAFTAGLSSVGYVLWRFYKVRTERNYHTL